MWRYFESLAEAETPKYGLRLLARQLLKIWWMRMLRGVRIYTNRDELQAHRSWERVMRNLKTMDACFVVAHNALHANVDLSKIQRMLLPNPHSQSTVEYAQVMNDNSLIGLIQKSTDKCRQENIRVKWLNHFCYYSFFIANRDNLNPYVHIEFALPRLRIGNRPSVTIYKKTHPKIFQEFVAAYDALWDRCSKEPDNGTREIPEP